MPQWFAMAFDIDCTRGQQLLLVSYECPLDLLIEVHSILVKSIAHIVSAAVRWDGEPVRGNLPSALHGVAKAGVAIVTEVKCV